jgi:hypothetical protein
MTRLGLAGLQAERPDCLGRQLSVPHLNIVGRLHNGFDGCKGDLPSVRQDGVDHDAATSCARSYPGHPRNVGVLIGVFPCAGPLLCGAQFTKMGQSWSGCLGPHLSR